MHFTDVVAGVYVSPCFEEQFHSGSMAFLCGRDEWRKRCCSGENETENDNDNTEVSARPTLRIKEIGGKIGPKKEKNIYDRLKLNKRNAFSLIVIGVRYVVSISPLGT